MVKRCSGQPAGSGSVVTVVIHVFALIVCVMGMPVREETAEHDEHIRVDPTLEEFRLSFSYPENGSSVPLEFYATLYLFVPDVVAFRSTQGAYMRCVQVNDRERACDKNMFGDELVRVDMLHWNKITAQLCRDDHPTRCNQATTVHVWGTSDATDLEIGIVERPSSADSTRHGPAATESAPLVDDWESLLQWEKTMTAENTVRPHRFPSPAVRRERMTDECIARNPIAVVGVKSARANFARRQLLRSTWIHRMHELDLPLCVWFLLGGSTEDSSEYHERQEHALVSEQLAFGDTLLGDDLVGVHDSYYGLVAKTLAWLTWTVQHLNAHVGNEMRPAFRYSVQLDDDVFVDPAGMVEVLRLLPEQRVYTGQVLQTQLQHELHPRRSASHKNFVPYEQYPLSVFPPFAFGPHYVLSQDVVAWIAANQASLRGVGTLEDVSIAVWLMPLQIFAQHSRHFDALRESDLCTADVVSLADVPPVAIPRAFDNVRGGKPICDGLSLPRLEAEANDAIAAASIHADERPYAVSKWLTTVQLDSDMADFVAGKTLVPYGRASSGGHGWRGSLLDLQRGSGVAGVAFGMVEQVQPQNGSVYLDGHVPVELRVDAVATQELPSYQRVPVCVLVWFDPAMPAYQKHVYVQSDVRIPPQGDTVSVAFNLTADLSATSIVRTCATVGQCPSEQIKPLTEVCRTNKTQAGALVHDSSVIFTVVGSETLAEPSVLPPLPSSSSAPPSHGEATVAAAHATDTPHTRVVAAFSCAWSGAVQLFVSLACGSAAAWETDPHYQPSARGPTETMVVFCAGDNLDAEMSEIRKQLSVCGSATTVRPLPGLIASVHVRRSFAAQSNATLELDNAVRRSGVGGEGEQDSRMTAFIHTLSRADVFLLSNTGSDPLAAILLHLAEQVRVPIRLLDLPNILPPQNIMESVQGLIAPSEFVRRVQETFVSTASQPPIAVIAPGIPPDVACRAATTFCAADARKASWASDPSGRKTSDQAVPSWCSVCDTATAKTPAAPLASRPGFRVGYVGDITPRRCLLLLVEAVALLVHRGDIPIELCIAGDSGTALARSIRVYAQDCGLTEGVNIAWEGKLSRTDMSSFYESLDVLANPRVDGETFGVALLEATALGVPVVAFSTGANAEATHPRSVDLLPDPHSAVARQSDQSLPKQFADALARVHRRCAARGPNPSPPRSRCGRAATNRDSDTSLAMLERYNPAASISAFRTFLNSLHEGTAPVTAQPKRVSAFLTRGAMYAHRLFGRIVSAAFGSADVEWREAVLPSANDSYSTADLDADVVVMSALDGACQFAWNAHCRRSTEWLRQRYPRAVLIMLVGEAWPRLSVDAEHDLRWSAVDIVLHTVEPRPGCCWEGPFIYLPVFAVSMAERAAPEAAVSHLLEGAVPARSVLQQRRAGVAYLYNQCRGREHRELFVDQLREAFTEILNSSPEARTHERAHLLQVHAIGACQGASLPRSQDPRVESARWRDDWHDRAVDALQEFQFVIAFEAEVVDAPGYVSEKLVNAMLADAIPVYLGSGPNPHGFGLDVSQLFNNRSMVDCWQFLRSAGQGGQVLVTERGLRRCAQAVASLSADLNEVPRIEKQTNEGEGEAGKWLRWDSIEGQRWIEPRASPATSYLLGGWESSSWTPLTSSVAAGAPNVMDAIARQLAATYPTAQRRGG